MTPRTTPSFPFSAMIQAGLLVGTLDVGVAMAIYGKGPVIVLQSIASGLLGRQAYLGGLPVAGLGLLLQWAMSMLIAGIFMFAARRLPALIRRWVVCGIAYGAVAFVVMNYVVVPLSGAGHGLPHFSALRLLENLFSMIVFGLIIAWFAQRYAQGSGTA